MSRLFDAIAQEYHIRRGYERVLYVLGFLWIVSLLFWIVVLFYSTSQYGKTFEEKAPGYARILQGFGLATLVLSVFAALLLLFV